MRSKKKEEYKMVDYLFKKIYNNKTLKCPICGEDLFVNSITGFKGIYEPHCNERYMDIEYGEIGIEAECGNCYSEIIIKNYNKTNRRKI